MTPIAPLAPPPCHTCGGEGEITDPHDDPMVCQHCGGSGEEPPVSETVLEERGQGTLFTPALIVLLSLLVGIGLVDTAIVLAIALSELRSWRRHRRDRDAHAIPIESRRRPYPSTSREWERWA